MDKTEMVRKFLRLNRGQHWGGRRSFIGDAEIVWEGTNYFVVRSGVRHDGCRYTWLADKVGVMCDEDSPALMKIAAEWHEAHEERVKNPETLHCSFIDDTEARFSGRWCKSLKQRVIAYAKVKDTTYHEDMEQSIVDWEIAKAEELAHEKAGRIISARIIKGIRKYSNAPRRVRRSWDSHRAWGNLANGAYVEVYRCTDAEGNWAMYFDSLQISVPPSQFDATIKALSEIGTAGPVDIDY